MLHGASGDGVFLGDFGAADVTTCTRETGMTAEQCEQFLLMAGLPTVPDLQTAVIRGTLKAAILYAGTKGCSYGAQAYGVPMPVAKAGCAYLIGKVMPYVTRLLDAIGQPAMLKGSMLIGLGPMFSRPCQSAAELKPGEHLVRVVDWMAQRDGAPFRCELNVAVLRPRDKPVENIVYVPCEVMPTGVDHDMLPRGVAACRDRDGVVRPIGRKSPQAIPGLYTERHKPGERWPAALEQNPWQGDIARPSVSAMGLTTAPTTAPAGASYPTGSIGAYDVKLGVFRIASPAGLSGAAAYREVATSPTLPKGVAEVDLATYEKQTGTRPWYKKGSTWAVVVTGSAAIAAGVVVVSRRRRRRR
jgi:hypothetical protein